MNILVKKTDPNAIMPEYQTDGAACFDLHAIGPADPCCDGLEVAPWKPLTVRTGLSFEIPRDHVMLVFSRSGHGFKNNVRLCNSVGMIDSDFRGEVMVKLTADDAYAAHAPLRVKPGDRIAHAMIIEARKVKLVEVDELTHTARGTGGFGSTG